MCHLQHMQRVVKFESVLLLLFPHAINLFNCQFAYFCKCLGGLWYLTSFSNKTILPLFRSLSFAHTSGSKGKSLVKDIS